MRTRPHLSMPERRACRRAHGLPRGERGAAIITALLVVALAAILVSGMLWRQQVQVRRIENQRMLAQAQWVARGALDWTRMILRSEGDTAPGITYLGGIWAVPIAKTKLSDFLGRIGAPNQGGDDTYISGSIEDAQAKFNLRNLIASPAPGVLQLNVAQLAAFQRLLTTLGYDGAFAKRIALQVRAGLMHSATRFQLPTLPGGGMAPTAPVMGGDTQAGGFTDDPGLADSERGPAPLTMTSVDSLLDVDGVTPEMVARLRPFVTVLPTTTPVNMNTAPAEVIAALVPGMSVSSAQALVSRRETVFFRNVGDVQLALRGAGAPGVQLDASLIDVNSSYFVVHGRIQHDRAEVDRTSLVYRDPTTHSTRVVRIRDQL
ncbi:type II secretion system minor pseudopilin GspK [Burkholderia multivorans]|uniref:type II secretion system minor pseudopilin GspK n=1 Tax=Burkholderia multivorans TaxID=87883 RepID=UPI000CFFEEDE|nr:type II secretion system minor pseudopilin GspK [Burkholderia multivorans]MBR7895490.1 type II secretion system minor pseudopilin GspK [Burkholderia multivorans]MBR8454995.1 type II secretion system minor pseudopilin GspK [Burkholderia multivorans]MBU9451095.1 type II secretion system minor pseudopilin GspK [Burkholderia multivorans]MCL4644538.1 type II secretion system minor pseudopilin GspK [Burkholderia multivorans]MDN7946235.1 type II secretion system minor pseudopilin GspK [Burkholderi